MAGWEYLKDRLGDEVGVGGRASSDSFVVVPEEVNHSVRYYLS